MQAKKSQGAKLYGIGVGPGEPGLITLKAFYALKNSNLIFIPKAHSEKDSLAYEIIKNVFKKYSDNKITPPATRELIFPMKKDPDELRHYWDQATYIILEELKENKVVSLITLGDPTLYSTYCYILQQISNYLPVNSITTIPGIYSFSAISSRLNLPLALGEEKLIIIPVEKNNHYTEQLQNYENIIFMKASSDFDNLIEDLIKTNRLNESVLISRLGQHDESITWNIENLKGTKIDYFSTLIVNPRVKLVGDLNER